MKELGLTQRRLAETLGVSRATVNAWCTNTKTPSRANAIKIASALEFPLEFLEYGNPHLAPAPSEEAIETLRRQYADETGWYFRPAPTDGGRQIGNPVAIASPPTLADLVRVCSQNALDAAIPGKTTVDVKFSVIEITGDHIQQFLTAIRWGDLEPHLTAAAHTNPTIRQALEALHTQDRLVLLRVDDYGTTGLTGPETGSGKFAAVARNTFDSTTRPRNIGTFRLGKETLWAISSFGLVLMNSTLPVDDDDQVGRFLGRVTLPWHETDRTSWAGPGWLGRQVTPGAPTVSYWNNDAFLTDVHLNRDDTRPGTSFLIVGVTNPNNTPIARIHQEIVDAVANNFRAALTGTPSVPPTLRATVSAERNGAVVQNSVIHPAQFTSPDVTQDNDGDPEGLDGLRGLLQISRKKR